MVQTASAAPPRNMACRRLGNPAGGRLTSTSSSDGDGGAGLIDGGVAADGWTGAAGSWKSNGSTGGVAVGSTSGHVVESSDGAETSISDGGITENRTGSAGVTVSA